MPDLCPWVNVDYRDSLVFCLMLWLLLLGIIFVTAWLSGKDDQPSAPPQGQDEDQRKAA